MGQRYNVDGHIYEEQPGGGYILVDPGQGMSGGIVTRSADPSVALDRALKAAALAKAARDAANAPLDTRKTAAETAKAEAEAIAARAKAGEAADPRRAQAMSDLNQDSTFRAIQQAQGDLRNGRAAGWWSYLKPLPGTNAQLVGSDLATINAQNMLGKLAEMKAQSAAGASGMGALSDTEGRILRDSIANLDQSLPQDRLLANLKFIEDHYRRAAAISHGLNPDQVDLTQRQVASPTDVQQQTLSRNNTQSVEDPALKAVAEHIGTMVAKGVPDEEIKQYLRDAGVPPESTSIDSALAFRRTKDFETWQRQNPGRAYPVGPSFYTKEVPLTTTRAMVNTIGQSPVGAYLSAAGEGVTANHLDNIAGALGGNADQVRAGEDLLRSEHPTASLAGDVSGQVLDEALLGRIPGAKALLASRWGRRGVDAAYGAVSGQGTADDGSMSGALAGAAMNTLGGVTGRNLQRGAGVVVGGMKDPTLNYLNARGIPMTLGQIARSGSDLPGKMIAGIEDRVSGYPIIGDVIKSARLRGSEGLNRAAFNEGLAPIGKTTGELTGAAAVDSMQNTVSQSFSDALNGVNVPQDAPFAAEYAAARSAAAKIPVHGPQLVHTLDTTVAPYLKNGNVTGEDLQTILQRLRSESATYNGVPGGQTASDALGNVESSLSNLFSRQAPEVGPKLAAANQAYGNQQTLQRAVNGQASELATPSSLRRAAISNTTKYGGFNKASSTDRPFYDLAANAQQVLPSTTPDSGTAGRWIIPSLAMTAAGGIGAGTADNGDRLSSGAKDAGIALAGAALLGSPYSRGGQKAIQALLLGQRIKQLSIVGDLLRRNPQLLGGAIGAGVGRERTYPAVLPTP